MTLTELRYIVSLAQERHFGRAAELCHVSQPTLSIAVKKVEQTLGVALFERTRGCVHPTPLGERVVSKAREVLERATSIEDLVTEAKDPLIGPLALGTLPSIGPYLLPQFIPLLQKLACRMPLYVEEGDSPQLAKKLRSGELDVLITVLPFSEPDIVTQPLFDEPFVVLLPAAHPLATKTDILPDDLDRDEVLLLAQGHSFREQILAAFPHLRSSADTDAVRERGTTLETLRHMVASGLGITLLPQMAADMPFYTPNLLVTRPLAGTIPARKLALSWRATFPRHQAIDVLRRAVQASSSAYWRFSTGRQANPAGILVENGEW